MTGPLTALVILGVLLAALQVLRVGLDFASHVGRYRRYRRSFPAVDRGRVWSYTR